MGGYTEDEVSGDFFNSSIPLTFNPDHMKEYKLDFMKSAILLAFTSLLLVASIHLSLGEVGLQILGVHPISKNISSPSKAVPETVAITSIQIIQTK